MTIKEIALHANVSIATVSRVINKSGFVSDDKIRRVNEALEELDYKPNLAAKSLRGGKSQSIGLIVPDNSNPFFAELGRYIENISYQNDYNIMLCDSDYSIIKEEEYINILAKHRVDGIIMISSGDSRILTENSLHIPFIVVDQNITDSHGRKIIIDYKQGGYLATSHLAELGHKRIGCITGTLTNKVPFQRLLGYKEAMADYNLPVDESLIVEGDFKLEGGFSAMKKLLNEDNPPSAVFVLNDFMAIGAMHAIHESGSKVPDNISVVGYDNIHFSSVTNPPLTTVAHPIDFLAQTIMDMLMSCIDEKESVNPGGIIGDNMISPKLLIRKSTIRLKA